MAGSPSKPARGAEDSPSQPRGAPTLPPPRSRAPGRQSERTRLLLGPPSSGWEAQRPLREAGNRSLADGQEGSAAEAEPGVTSALMFNKARMPGPWGERALELSKAVWRDLSAQGQGTKAKGLREALSWEAFFALEYSSVVSCMGAMSRQSKQL